MKRIISIILIAVSLLSITSCDKDREYDEAEVKVAAESLIRSSKRLNEIFWGSGIGYVEDDNMKNGYYYPADPIVLRDLGYETVDDILEDTEKVFSESYSLSIAQSVFAAKVGDYGMVGYTRYYQGVEAIMVYTKYKPLLTDEVEYLYETLTVVGSKKEVVTVKISVNVTRGESVQTREIEIDLVEEENGWRIDSPTYTSYRESEVPK